MRLYRLHVVFRSIAQLVLFFGTARSVNDIDTPKRLMLLDQILRTADVKSSMVIDLPCDQSTMSCCSLREDRSFRHGANIQRTIFLCPRTVNERSNVTMCSTAPQCIMLCVNRKIDDVLILHADLRFLRTVIAFFVHI